MRPKPKMLHCLPRILRSPQQQRITPRRRPERQLIQSQALPARLLDPSPRGSRKVKCRNGEFLRYFEQACIVGDGADDDNGFDCWGYLLAGAAGGEHAETAEGEGGAVGAGHEEAAENDFVEV